MLSERSSGILLHPASLPGKFGIGTFGGEAYKFVDFLAFTKQKLWQILPLTHTGDGSCPYNCISAFAGNPLLISLEKLKDEGLLVADDLIAKEKFNDEIIEYSKVRKYKFPLLKKAFRNFNNSKEETGKNDFIAFCEKEKSWLDDFCFYVELKNHFGKKSWSCWDTGVKLRKNKSLEKYKKLLYDKIEFQKFLQYVFYKQWHQLKKYANYKNIKIIGDIPIFVSYDSADVWANPGVFNLDRKMLPKEVSGVPPDFFSKTGQLWGNPVYDWRKLKQQGYQWWVERIGKTMNMADIIRLDHFRGFVKYWAIPYGNKTAEKGKWREVPGEDVFSTLEDVFGKLPVIVEDLGYITPSVLKLKDEFGFAGMIVLHFSLNKNEIDSNKRKIFPVNSVVYTGTHDNDTTLGWYEKLGDTDKEVIGQYIHSDGKDIIWDLIIHAWASESAFAIVPMQDILSLGSHARMNLPGTTKGNWQWRYRKDQITPEIIERLRRITEEYKR